MKFKGVQNATFDENPHENERISDFRVYNLFNFPWKVWVHGWLANTMDII